MCSDFTLQRCGLFLGVNGVMSRQLTLTLVGAGASRDKTPDKKKEADRKKREADREYDGNKCS